MSIIEVIYEETMSELCAKGFRGYVERIDPYYKNASMTTPTSVVDNPYTPPKTKNGQSSAGLFLLDGGAFLPNREVR